MQITQGSHTASQRGPVLYARLASSQFAVRLLFAALICTHLSACQEQSVKSFAAALAADDRSAVQIEIDNVLAAQEQDAPIQQRIEAIQVWIEQQDGIQRAEINPVLLDSYPTVQQVWVTLTADPDNVRTVGIVVDGKHLRFNLP